MGLMTYRGPGQDDPSLGGRFQLPEGPGKVATTVLGKRRHEQANVHEDT